MFSDEPALARVELLWGWLLLKQWLRLFLLCEALVKLLTSGDDARIEIIVFLVNGVVIVHPT